MPAAEVSFRMSGQTTGSILTGPDLPIVITTYTLDGEDGANLDHFF